MLIGRSRNIRNSVWNLANITLYPLAFLAMTPFFIDRMGEHLFGTWMVLNSVVFISVQLLHFGMGQSLTIYVAEARGRDNPQRLNRFYNSALNFTGLESLGMLLLAMLTWWLAPRSWFEWEGIRDAADLHLAMALTMAVVSAKFFEQFFLGFYKGFEEFDTAAKFNIAHKLVTLAGHATAVVLGYGLAAVMLVSALTNALLALAQFLWSKSYLVNYAWNRAFDRIIFGRLGAYGFWSWLQMLIGLLSFQLDRLVVAMALGMDVVAYYTIASMIANHLHMALEAVVGWVFPAVSRLVNESRDPAPLFITVRSFLLTFALVGLGALYLLREPLFTLWLGTEKYLEVIPFIELFILFEVFYILSITPKFYLNGLAKLRLITGIELGYKGFSILLMLVFFYFGRSATSLIWGQIAAMMIAMPLEMALVNHRVLRQGWFFEGVLVALPCFALFLALYVSEPALQAALALATVALGYFVYIRHRHFDAKLLLE